MNQTFNKISQDRGSRNKGQILSTLQKGFTSFYDVNFPSRKKQRTTAISKRIRTLTSYTSQKAETASVEASFQEECPVLAETLRHNKSKLGRVKTEVQSLRHYQFSQYIKKSLRHQQLLNLNENKKKHLPTLNAKIGQIIKKSTVQALQKNISYQIKYQKISLEGWKPQSREGHTCIIHKGNAFIIGGHCSHPFSTVQVYSIDKNVWAKQIANPIARSYHTSLLYKNRFIITFGGMGNYDVSRKCRGCFNSVSLIDLGNFTNRQMRMHNQDNVEARRSHSAVLMSKNMLVFGGMNSKKQFLNDLVYLDLKELRWYHKELKIEGRELSENMESGIAKHNAISIFKQRKHLPLYLADYAEHQGMYVFGGGYGNGQENVLLQLTFNKYIPVLRKVDYSGLPPSSTDPVLQKFNDLILIVSGDQRERQIRLFKPNTRQFTVINDSYSRLLGGIGSSIAEYENKYFVFFGLGEDGYIGTPSKFVIEEKIKEKESHKKKVHKLTNGEIIDWKQSHLYDDSDDDISF